MYRDMVENGLRAFVPRDPRLKFDQPSGICFDKSGNLLVADTRNHRMVALTPSGAPFLTSLLQAKTNVSHLSHPMSSFGCRGSARPRFDPDPLSDDSIKDCFEFYQVRTIPSSLSLSLSLSVFALY
jgi:hypothetical protein